MAACSPELEWRRDFDAALRRPLRQVFDFYFIRTPQPVIDDAPYRSFDSLEEYRRWCRENLPEYLGYA